VQEPSKEITLYTQNTQDQTAKSRAVSFLSLTPLPSCSLSAVPLGVCLYASLAKSSPVNVWIVPHTVGIHCIL